MRRASILLLLAVMAGCSSSNSQPGKKGASLDSREIPGAMAIGSNQNRGIPKVPGLIDIGPAKTNLGSGQAPGPIDPASSVANPGSGKPLVPKSGTAPAKNLTDGEFVDVLTGLWDERVIQADQSIYDRQLALLKSGAMMVRGSIRHLPDAQVFFFVTGTWRVEGGRLHLAVQTTNAPKLVPFGTKSADVLLSASAAQFSYFDGPSKQTRVLHRSTLKVDFAQLQREIDGEMERLLRGGTWGDEQKLPDGSAAVRRITFELRGEFTALIRYLPNKKAPVTTSGSWQITNGTLHIVVKTSSQPQIVAIGSKTADKIRFVNGTEFTYVDGLTRQTRIVRRESD